MNVKKNYRAAEDLSLSKHLLPLRWRESSDHQKIKTPHLMEICGSHWKFNFWASLTLCGGCTDLDVGGAAESERDDSDTLRCSGAENHRLTEGRFRDKTSALHETVHK